MHLYGAGNKLERGNQVRFQETKRTLARVNAMQGMLWREGVCEGVGLAPPRIRAEVTVSPIR